MTSITLVLLFLIILEDSNELVYAQASAAIEAMDAGKDVFIEKPMVLTKPELKEVIEARDRNGVRLSSNGVDRADHCSRSGCSSGTCVVMRLLLSKELRS